MLRVNHILKSLLQPIRELIDPHQYAYQQKKSVQDAILYLTHLLYKHTDEMKTYVRALFVDFSSAFNTIRFHILVEKLKRLGVRPSLILWIVDFFFFLAKSDPTSSRAGHNE